MTIEKIEYSKRFIKQFDQLRKNEKLRVIKTIELFRVDPFNKKLRNHQLLGEFDKYRSISAGGDIRLHYREKNDAITITFVAIGTHSQLYS